MPELFGALETTPNGFTGSDSVLLCLGEMPVAAPPFLTPRAHRGSSRLDTQMRVGGGSLGEALLIFTKWLGGIILGDGEAYLVKLSCSSSS